MKNQFTIIPSTCHHILTILSPQPTRFQAVNSTLRHFCSGYVWLLPKSKNSESRSLTPTSRKSLYFKPFSHITSELLTSSRHSRREWSVGTCPRAGRTVVCSGLSGPRSLRRGRRWRGCRRRRRCGRVACLRRL